MKSLVLAPVLFLLAVTEITVQSADPKVGSADMDVNGETAYLNFIKVLASILVTDPEPPKVVMASVKVLLRELMNGNPSEQGYFSYLTTSLLRVFGSPLQTQVDTVLQIIMKMNDERTSIHKATRILQEFLSSRQSDAVYADIANFVSNLFQPAVVTPHNVESPFITDSLSRPASGRRPISKLPNA